MTGQPGPTPAATGPLTVDEIFAGAASVRTSDDLASPALFDDGEVDEFLADLQTMRRADNA